ncbi:aminotransferase class I/II-fold pyridoxal phosphate-dependent enzyme [Niabella hibiscisoli]|uniref:aminotransferase class I/II-fold pyridoxal phosphate-dependent enzyme n=1 Tax=Niabella hibiscisoli TaxID=1825928 RepID=UPI001F0D79C6|nr:aminotransferase class I/II-fold pyridoxal phosphate-dependent enzyme [Niabella hibiscisoli]MCH5718235.1 aminotransferase class I/II-fold pyridoxal phosphate-dependent enzyme [Niabella hibiscisoli]
MMGYGNELGDPEFINAIVRMLNHQRGMQINHQSICITRGSQMAMYLVAQCLLSKGDFVMVENPGYKPAWKAFENAGAELLPIRVDQDGLVIDEVVACLARKRRSKPSISPHITNTRLP